VSRSFVFNELEAFLIAGVSIRVWAERGWETGGQGREKAGNGSFQLADTIQFSKSIPPPSRERATSLIANHAGTLLGARQMVAGVDFGLARQESLPYKPKGAPPTSVVRDFE